MWVKDRLNPADDDDEDDRPDERDLACPKCGCNDCKITQYPIAGSWFDSTGKARCNFCTAVFSIRIDEAPNPRWDWF